MKVPSYEKRGQKYYFKCVECNENEVEAWRTPGTLYRNGAYYCLRCAQCTDKLNEQYELDFQVRYAYLIGSRIASVVRIYRGKLDSLIVSNETGKSYRIAGDNMRIEEIE